MWLEAGILKDLYPDLFSISGLQDVSVTVMGGWSHSIWRWGDFGVSSGAYVAGGLAEKLQCLREQLCDWQPVLGSSDSAFWMPESDGIFSIISCHKLISSQRIPHGPSDRFDSVLGSVWRMEVPIKIKSFGWKCFVNILPSKEQLSYRGIIFISNHSCVFSCCNCETTLHSLLVCHVVDLVWKDMRLGSVCMTIKLVVLNKAFLNGSLFANSPK